VATACPTEESCSTVTGKAACECPSGQCYVALKPGCSMVDRSTNCGPTCEGCQGWGDKCLVTPTAPAGMCCDSFTDPALNCSNYGPDCVQCP
jgi:hypothetical protein